MSKPLKVIKNFAMITIIASFTTLSHADISEIDVQNFAKKISISANQKDIASVSQLVGDDALISVSRRGKTSTLDKPNYLSLLQTNWAKATHYQYNIKINNVISTGTQAKADIVTTEIIREDKNSMRLITTSRATFVKTDKGVVLTRAISELVIE